MKNVKSRFLALFSSFGALLGSCGAACGVACVAGGCCGSTALFGFIGLSGSTMQFFEKLTPLFLVLTVFSLGYAFYKAYQPKNAECCDKGSETASTDCCSPKPKSNFFRSKSFLWAITVLSVIMWTYPYFSQEDNSKSNCNTTETTIESNKSNDDPSGSDCCEASSSCTTDCSTEKK